jgi:methionyl-tRNA synthetase
LASLKNWFDQGGPKAQHGETRSFDEYMAADDTEQYHFIGKDIVTFHTLFWPAILKFSGRKVPHKVFVHGFLTVNNGEKMSKSRGTGLNPLKYLELGMNPEWLRYYLAAKLNGRNEDIDFNADDFLARVNSDLVGKYINIASRAAGFIAKRFGGQLGTVSADGEALLAQLHAGLPAIEALYDNRDCAKALRDTMALADRVNEYVDANKPWERCVQHLHRGLPFAQSGFEARAASPRRQRGSVFEHRTFAVRPARPTHGRGSHHRHLPTPDAARGPQDVGGFV